MKVLFISALFPYPLHSGGQVRLFNLLKELSGEHEITLFSFIRSKEEEQYIAHMPFCPHIRTFLRGHVWQPQYVWKALTSSYPLLVASYDHTEMREAITKELQRTQYDCIHIEPFYVYPVLPPTTIPVVVSEHNIEYQVYEKLAQSLPTTLVQHIGAWDVKKMRKSEEAQWKYATAVTAVSTSDATYIKKRAGEHNVYVVPNGIDPTYFSYKEQSFDKKTPTFLFVGNFSWKPNEDALRLLMKRYWPRIVEKFPEATLTVCGKYLSQGLSEALKQKQVTYLSSVEDIRTLYTTHDILLAPFTYGGGTKFKILEAMASGTLVVTTKPGIEGIDAVDREHVLIADSDESFVSLISYAYANAKNMKHITKKARIFVEKTYDWKAIGERLSLVWKKTV